MEVASEQQVPPFPNGVSPAISSDKPPNSACVNPADCRVSSAPGETNSRKSSPLSSPWGPAPFPAGCARGPHPGPGRPGRAEGRVGPGREVQPGWRHGLRGQAGCKEVTGSVSLACCVALGPLLLISNRNGGPHPGWGRTVPASCDSRRFLEPLACKVLRPTQSRIALSTGERGPLCNNTVAKHGFGGNRIHLQCVPPLSSRVARKWQGRAK